MRKPAWHGFHLTLTKRLATHLVLCELNAFVISDVNYAARNTDGSLDSCAKDSNPGGLTDEYLVDRAAMLAWKECRQDVAFSLYCQLAAAKSVASCAYSTGFRRRIDRKNIGNRSCRALRAKRDTLHIHRHAC